MKILYRITIISILSSGITLHSAESNPILSKENISFCIGYPEFTPSTPLYDHALKFDPFVSSKVTYTMSSIKKMGEVRESFALNQSLYAKIPVLCDSIAKELEDTAAYQKYVKEFFTVALLVKLINQRFMPGFELPTNRIINLLSATTWKNLDTNFISFLLALRNFAKHINRYQLKRDPAVFNVLLNFSFINNLISLARENKEQQAITITCPVIGDLSELIINSIFDTIEHPHARSKHLILFFHREKMKLLTYYLSRMSRTQEGEKLQLTAFNNFIHRYGLESLFTQDKMITYDPDKKALQLNLSEESKSLYWNIYNKATANNTQPLYIEIENFWTGKNKIRIHVTPTIEGVLEGYTPVVEESVEETMRRLGLEEEKPGKKSGKGKKASKQPQHKHKPAAAAAIAEPATQESTSFDDIETLYTFNKDLVNKNIELAERINQWYSCEKEMCTAITAQGYLDPSNPRNSIFKKLVANYKGNKQKALEHIIFRHQLPYSLIKTILMYGQKTPDSTRDHTTLTALVCYKKDAIEEYYQAEIAGKIVGKNIYIWHSFLSDIENVTSYMRNIINSLPPELHFLEEEDRKKVQEAEFTLLGETNDWKVDNQSSCVIISKDNMKYIVFKN